MKKYERDTLNIYFVSHSRRQHPKARANIQIKQENINQKGVLAEPHALISAQ